MYNGERCWSWIDGVIRVHVICRDAPSTFFLASMVCIHLYILDEYRSHHDDDHLGHGAFLVAAIVMLRNHVRRRRQCSKFDLAIVDYFEGDHVGKMEPLCTHVLAMIIGIRKQQSLCKINTTVFR